MTNKVFIFLPDGIGLRNFAFSDFYNLGIKDGFDIVHWNNTVFDLNALGLKEIRIRESKLHLFTDILKNAKIHISLNQFIRRTNDKVYDTYRFPLSNKDIKSKLKTTLTKGIIKQLDSQNGLKIISQQIKRLECNTSYYKKCLETLKKEKPIFVLCTNQRPATAIAPLLAAQELGIPTATFIFSWDNLPKATMVVETDYYFVWSTHMKNELMFYYPHIKENQIFISGTPQFEAHFDKSKL
ncbi:MAG: UDP-glycosyltransferase, partial [Lutibacter sp.]